jgi:hypothetical protein
VKTYREFLDDLLDARDKANVTLYVFGPGDATAGGNLLPEAYWPGISNYTDAWDDATHVALPGTGWGDYSGSILDRAAYAELAGVYGSDYSTDMPGLAELHEGYGYHQVLLHLDTEMPEHDDWALEDTTAGSTLTELFDHGHLSDLDVWQAEESNFRENWEGFLERDFREMVAAAIVGATVQGIRVTDADPADALDLVPSGEALTDLMHEAPTVRDYGLWETETATDGVLIHADDIAEWVAEQTMREYVLPVTHEGQGELTLTDAA